MQWEPEEERSWKYGDCAYPFIVIEGIDGVGKTTIGGMLAQELGAAFFQTPHGIWRRVRWLVENAHPWIRFCYYLTATLAFSRMVSKVLYRQPVVCDRYIYSTWAHHFAYGCTSLEKFDFHSLPLVFPDKAFYLCVDSRERKRRVNKRSQNKPKDKDEVSLKKAHQMFLQFSDLRLVNTTGLSKEESVQKILRCL